jgi:CheY-like chemotaxis protein
MISGSAPGGAPVPPLRALIIEDNRDAAESLRDVLMRRGLAQALGNLLHNACKFTPAGGRVTVTVAETPAGGHARVAVRDTGRGIGAEVLPRLFDPFAQADASLDRGRGGLGLGLALVKGLVELHGGTVDAASDGPGRGTTVTLTLPLAPAAPEATPGEPPRPPCPPRRVLLIEDNHDAAETLSELLTVEGHVVEVAYTGPEGLARARAFCPDIVLCDIGLPLLDGYQVARALRADPDLARTPLVALTGYARTEDMERARAAGFDAHLAKPPTVAELTRVLGALAEPRLRPRGDHHG